MGQAVLGIDAFPTTSYNKHSILVGAEIAQLVERWTENPGVPSSILGLGTIFKEGGSMRKTSAVFTFFIFLIISLGIWNYTHTEAKESPREFELTYHAFVRGLPSEGREVRVWIPLARTDGTQKILERRVACPYPYEVVQEPHYGNEILYLSFNPPFPAQIDVAVTYHAVVQEKRRPLKETLGERELYLASNRMMVVDEKIRDLSKEVTADKEPPFDQARAIYDYVISHMQYDKTTPGWGKGDTLRACLIGKGNCTDFHSLFISLARARDIPSRFNIGLPLPETEEGEIPGYHCWAEFYVSGKGWVPVDASEAWKHPEKRDYYFGTTDPNRLLISTGRDIELVPKQEGEPLNIFFYPYVEIDGRPYPSVETKFHFKDLQPKRGGVT